MDMAETKTSGDVNSSTPEATPLLTTRSRPFKFIPLWIERWLIPLALLAVALFFYVYALGRPSIWFDEAFSVGLARQPLPRLWQAIWGPEPNMELYYLLLHFWLQFTALLGQAPTEVIVRLPSAICAALSVLVVFFFGRRYFGTVGGTIAALLYLLSYSTLLYAQQTRSYALQLLLLCLSWYALAQLYTATHRRKWWWGLYVVAASLAFYAQLFSLVVFVAQVIAAVGLLILPGPWLAAARKGWKTVGSAFLAFIILSIPMLIVSFNGSRATGWLPTPHLHDLVNLLPVMTNGNHLLSNVIILVGLAGALLISFSYLFARQPVHLTSARWDGYLQSTLSSQDYLPVLWLVLCWLVLPIIISFVAAQGSMHLFSARYLMVIMPALGLLMGLSIVVLRVRIVQILLFCGLLYLTFTSTLSYYPNAQIENWRTAALWVQQHYQKGDGLICYDNIQGCQTSIEYYLYAYPISQAQFTDDAPGNLLSWRTNSGYVAPDTNAGAALDTTAIAAYAQKHMHIFYIVGRLSGDRAAAQVKQAEAWMDSHYHFLGQIKSAGNITVRLYEVSQVPQSSTLS